MRGSSLSFVGSMTSLHCTLVVLSLSMLLVTGLPASPPAVDPACHNAFKTTDGSTWQETCVGPCSPSTVECHQDYVGDLKVCKCGSVVSNYPCVTVQADPVGDPSNVTCRPLGDCTNCQVIMIVKVEPGSVKVVKICVCS